MKNNLQISTSPVTSYNLFNTEVSFYIHKVDKAPKRRKLAAVLEDASRANEINRIREVLRAQGKEAYSAEKLKVPCFLVSVQCEGGHSKSCIVGYTGLLAFDLDAKDNPNWTPDE